MNYHGHIYFRSLDRAINEHSLLGQRFGALLKMFPIRKNPIGPHPTPSFGIAFEQGLLDQIRQWMIENTDWLIGLIHPIIADDVAAHTTHAEWIGGRVDLLINRLSSPPEQLDDLSLRRSSEPSSEMDIDNYFILKGDIVIGYCSMGTRYVKGRSILDCCQLYQLEVQEHHNEAVSRLLLQYLNNFTDCKKVYLSPALHWFGRFSSKGQWLV
jgi:aromatic ring-cleaving dioxygenase